MQYSTCFSVMIQAGYLLSAYFSDSMFQRNRLISHLELFIFLQKNADHRSRVHGPHMCGTVSCFSAAEDIPALSETFPDRDVLWTFLFACAAGDAGIRRTGWEESRRIYFETLFGYGQRNQEFNYGDRQAESQVYADSDRHISGGGLVIGNRIRGILEAGRIIENDTEDPEERRKRIEAQQAAANAGALIGLAVGIVSELAHRDDTPAEEKETEEQEFTMNM